MLAFTPGVPAAQRFDVLCVGAHCDDIEIGCAGTILALQRCRPNCRIHWLVLTSDAVRRTEAEAAIEALVEPQRRGEVAICDLPDGRLPAHFDEVKSAFEQMKRALEPQLVLTHHGADRHQDHALVADVTWQTFRDHAIWEYEIPKYDADLRAPNVFIPLARELVDAKVQTIMRVFASQRVRSWFRAENLEAAMRLRGLECRSASGFAEAFHCRKMVVLPGAVDG